MNKTATMKKIYFSLILAVGAIFSTTTYAQNCSLLNATFQTFESRCAATGAIKIKATGGSGSYKYRVLGPVNINFTSADSITGLSSGNYTIEVVDIVSGCNYTRANIAVPGDYSDPRFLLKTVSVSCDNGTNGTILVQGIDKGRSPFIFSIVAPSPYGVGTTNSTGIFNDLPSGDYSVRLADSCGGIQTRTVSVENYTWRIDSYSFTKVSCDFAKGFLKVIDSRGNVSTITGIPGMLYGILIDGSPDTLWSSDPNFNFNVGLGVKSIQAFAKDACGITKGISTKMFLYPSIDGNISTSNKLCLTFTARVTGIHNFFAPKFCLYDDNGNEMACNTTGLFTGLSYGKYCIKASDVCADTVINRCFTVARPVPAVGKNVTISGKNCSTFNVAVTGQRNLTNPEYCLFDKNDVLISCNTTGYFPNVPYGDYCIKTHDDCIDATFTNCFSVGQPVPRVDPVIVPAYVNCFNFGLALTGDSLYTPVYCLMDDLGVTIACNTTGIFDSIALGSYCVTIHDACTDTTIERCFAVGPPEATNDMAVSLINKTCSTFTAQVGTSRYNGNKFSLYDYKDSLLTSNNSGVFNDLPYGDYCVKTKPQCPDTILVTCFQAIAIVPSVSAAIDVSNKICATFDATVTGQTNLSNPVYYLTNSSGDTLSSNNTGKFTKVSYGSYCILIKDNCFDTTLKICEDVVKPVFKVDATASKSCNYEKTKINLSFSTYPVTFYIYNPSDVLVGFYVALGATSVDNLPNLPAGQEYKIVAFDGCSMTDNVMLAPIVGWLKHGGNVTQKCPGAGWSNGSGNVNAVATTNNGSLTVRIIKKDGTTLSPALVPNIVKDSIFTFQDLGPGSYIVRYNTAVGCNAYVYDTITVMPYQYPNLSRSSAYQCDVNGFTVGAVVTNGVGPFTYEIIGSTPAIPSIVAGPQSSPIFTINNGFNYSLIRLRALDACGNATLGDASILPLANVGIRASENCLGSETRLTVDTIYNSTVAWYYQKEKSDPDSVFLGGGLELVINPLTSIDTGYYYAIVELNHGCILRKYEFHLNGDCYPILPVMQIEFIGRYADEMSFLNWSIRNDVGLKSILVERKNGEVYETIGEVSAKDYFSPGQYRFIDEQPLTDNYYRLKLQFENGKVVYSKIIHLAAPAKGMVKIYPNPATDFVNVEFNVTTNSLWQVELLNVANQKTILKESVNGHRYQIHRTPGMASGMYILKVTNQKTGETYNYKVVFSKK